MIYCTNPHCPEPQNTDQDLTCRACGSALRLNDRYFALQLLGQSPLGRTFLAIEAENSHTKFIIQQVFPQLTSSPEEASKLCNLLQTLGEHPQFPRYIDSFTQADRLYLVQEFIDGQNLAVVLQEQGPFSETQIWQLLTALLPLLQFIHQHQIIHGDIKPESIVQAAASQMPENQFFLVNFGAAAATTQSATLIGSPEYAAPEQTRGKPTYASDLYSLGVTCIYLLTEVSPFDLYDSFSKRWIWRSCLPQPVSDRLAQVLDQLIQPAANLRFQTAEQAIQASGISRPVARRPKSQPVQTLKSYTPLDAILAPGAVNAIALHPTASILASAHDDKTICLWDVTTQQRLTTLTGKGVRSLVFNADGTRLISAGDDKTIWLWDWRSGKVITAFTGHTGSVRSIALSPEGQTLASASWDKTIRLWRLTGELIQVWHHDLQVMAVAFSPDGQWLASASCDRTGRLWPLVNPQPQPTILSGHIWAVLTVTFSPDSLMLATGSEDNMVKLWEVPTGRLIRTLTGHSWAIAALRFSPDGKTLLSASWDHTIKLWHVASGGLQATLEGHTDSVNAIAICPSASASGYEVFSGGRDKLIYRWRQSG